jgi:predicted RNA-binding protein with PIN domain
MQKIIIDGYNLIHADPALRRLAARGMEEARVGLLERLRLYLEAKRVQITVVFDGAGGMIDADPVIPGRLQVLYSAGGQTADEVIRTVLHGHPNPRQYIVITSDMADIGRSVGAVGATVMGSAEFLQRLSALGTDGAAPPTEATGEKPDPSEPDVEFWLRKFGENGDRDD